MTAEFDWLKPPVYEVNAEHFVSKAQSLSERFPDLFIGVFNITTSADFLHETSQEYERKGFADYAKELSEKALAADLDSADRNIVMVSITGDLKRAEKAERRFDKLTAKYKGIKGDRKLARLADLEGANPDETGFSIAQYYLFLAN